MVRKNTVAFEQWKIDQVAELQKRIGIKVDLSNTRPHILMGKDLPRAIWLHGKSGGGKTHMMAWAIREKIKKAPLKTKWVWVTIRPLIAAWSGQYSPETDVRIEAMSLIRTVRDAAIVGLDDVDKIGTITPAREEAFFDMFDDIYNKGVCLMVSSQFSIQEFCMRMPNEKMFTERDGIGPQTRRLLDICEQIKV
jgi:predicted ATPase